MRTPTILTGVLLASICGAAEVTGPPLDLVLIVDEQRGGPTGPPRARDLPDVFALQPEDSLGLIELKRKPSVRRALAREPLRFRPPSPVRVAPVWGRTQMGAGGRIYDAILSACGLFQGAPDSSRARAVLLISEDRERGSDAGVARAIGCLVSAKATLFLLRDFVMTPPPGWQMPPQISHPGGSMPQTFSVEPVVKQTGGEVRTSDRMSLTGMASLIREKMSAAGSKP